MYYKDFFRITFGPGVMCNKTLDIFEIRMCDKRFLALMYQSCIKTNKQLILYTIYLLKSYCNCLFLIRKIGFIRFIKLKGYRWYSKKIL